MDVYWYWPYVRREELALATGLLRAGDHLAVHSTPRPTDPVVSPHPDCEILPPLPGVDERTAEGSLRWAASRGTTYLARARARAAEVRGGHHDLAHVVYLNPFVDWVALRRLARQVPLVSSVHDVTPHQRRMPEALERRVLARQYAHAGTIVAIDAASFVEIASAAVDGWARRGGSQRAVSAGSARSTISRSHGRKVWSITRSTPAAA